MMTRYDTREITLQRAKALCATTLVDPDTGRRDALADRIDKLETCYRLSLAQCTHKWHSRLANPHILG
jgi:hypothetical protein